MAKTPATRPARSPRGGRLSGVVSYPTPRTRTVVVTKFSPRPDLRRVEEAARAVGELDFVKFPSAQSGAAERNNPDAASAFAFYLEPVSLF
jgi:hypothetical protein